MPVQCSRHHSESTIATVGRDWKEPDCDVIDKISTKNVGSVRSIDLNDVHMNSTTPAIRELARRLIALEMPRDARPGAIGSEAARVCEKLRVPFAKLAGTDGYHSLISRVIATAKGDFPALGPVEVRLDGSLEGFDKIGENDADAGVAVLVHLLDLLVTFIGEPVTLRLVRDAWPDATLEKTNSSAEEQS